MFKEGKYEQLDLIKEIDKMRAGEIKSMWVSLGEKEKFRTRLVLEKVSAQIANEKRRKLKSDKQNKRKNISEERLILFDVNAPSGF